MAWTLTVGLIWGLTLPDRDDRWAPSPLYDGPGPEFEPRLRDDQDPRDLGPSLPPRPRGTAFADSPLGHAHALKENLWMRLFAPEVLLSMKRAEAKVLSPWEPGTPQHETMVRFKKMTDLNTSGKDPFRPEAARARAGNCIPMLTIPLFVSMMQDISAAKPLPKPRQANTGQIRSQGLPRACPRLHLQLPLAP